MFQKVMSGMDVPALGLPKERFDQLRQFLHPPQRTQGQTLHFVLALNEAARDAALDVGPDHFIGIELQRVGRQKCNDRTGTGSYHYSCSVVTIELQ